MKHLDYIKDVNNVPFQVSDTSELLYVPNCDSFARQLGCVFSQCFVHWLVQILTATTAIDVNVMDASRHMTDLLLFGLCFLC